MPARQLEEYDVPENEVHRAVQETVERQPVHLDTHLRSRFFLLALFIAAGAMLVTIRSGIIASRGYALVQVQQQALALEQENEHLRIDTAKMKAPQRIKEIAVGQLGMVVPENVYFAADK
jgi:cell division protein FtsL